MDETKETAKTTEKTSEQTTEKQPVADEKTTTTTERPTTGQPETIKTEVNKEMVEPR
jgi:hypothetical protein